MNTAIERDINTDSHEIVENSTRHLSRKFAGIYDEAYIRPIVVESYRSFANARVQTFVAVFTTRFADDRLRALAKIDGKIRDTMPSVLFVCVHNAGRSQMAAGWVRHLAQDRVEVYSGGSDPGKQLNLAVVEAMNEVGIDISNEFPKPFVTEIVKAADAVITMGCGDTCPIFPGKRYEDWALEDPAGRGVEAVRPIRDEIRRRVVELLNDLGIETK
jgi:arsenate reductase (thioredoxin)